MSHFVNYLTQLGLDNYYEALQFYHSSTPNAVFTITEETMAELNIKRGHRRKIQRAIASYQGYPRSAPLPAPILRRAPMCDETASKHLLASQPCESLSYHNTKSKHQSKEHDEQQLLANIKAF